MLTAAALFFVGSVTSITPSDDIWVYPHAGDPGKDAALRIWGSGGKAAPGKTDEPGEFSMAYLKFSVAYTAQDLAKLKSARLVLTHYAGAGYSLEQATKAPLQARALTGDFDEKTWNFDLVEKVRPGEAAADVLGISAPTAIKTDGTFAVTIDLLKGPGDFRKVLAAAINAPKRELKLALTAALDMQALGRGAIYKVYSKDSENETYRPRLELEF